jgi:hypothetical protein
MRNRDHPTPLSDFRGTPPSNNFREMTHVNRTDNKTKEFS